MKWSSNQAINLKNTGSNFQADEKRENDVAKNTAMVVRTGR